jgi:hypothetical protein
MSPLPFPVRLPSASLKDTPVQTCGAQADPGDYTPQS